jgi:hypothetical protein
VAIQRLASEQSPSLLGDGVSTTTSVSLTVSPTSVINAVVNGTLPPFSVASYTVSNNIVNLVFTSAPPSGVINAFTVTITFTY